MQASSSSALFGCCSAEQAIDFKMYQNLTQEHRSLRSMNVFTQSEMSWFLSPTFLQLTPALQCVLRYSTSYLQVQKCLGQTPDVGERRDEYITHSSWPGAFAAPEEEQMLPTIIRDSSRSGVHAQLRLSLANEKHWLSYKGNKHSTKMIKSRILTTFCTTRDWPQLSRLM